MATVASHHDMGIHNPFVRGWQGPRPLRDLQKSMESSGPARKKHISKFRLPDDYVDPGHDQLRSVLLKTNAVMNRTTAGQIYESAVQLVNEEFAPPVQRAPGEWFPDVSEVYECMRESFESKKITHFLDILERLPFLFKAVDRIKVSWLRNNYPLAPRIVRALDRDDFELISENFPAPIADINRELSVMWPMERGDGVEPREEAGAPPPQPVHSAPAKPRRRTATPSRLLMERATASAEPDAVPRTTIPHRRSWNRLVRQYMEEQRGAARPATPSQSSSATSGSYSNFDPSTLVCKKASEVIRGIPAEEAAGLLDQLCPPWQTVADAERGDRRVADLGTGSSADDARLVLRRCRQQKQAVLSQMDTLYRDKIHQVEDNATKRYRRKVAYLVPPYRTCDADMPAIRRRVRMRSIREDHAMRSAVWFTRLQRLAATMGAAELPRCSELFESLLPFSRRQGLQVPRGMEKLCLLLMSVPMYEALTSGFQMAVLFMHVHFFGGAEAVFRSWLRARRLADATQTSPLIETFRHAADDSAPP